MSVDSRCSTARKRFGAAVLMLAATVCGGCSSGESDTVSVVGNVSFDGQPIEEGAIAFFSQEGHTVTAAIRAGKYAMSQQHGPRAGKYSVRISGRRKSGRKAKATDYSGGQETDLYEQFVPAIYNERTKLRVTIEAGKENTHNFDLSRGGKT